MKVGDLVKIIKHSIGLPPGSLGIITEYTMSFGTNGINMWTVAILGEDRYLTGRYLERDLKMTNERESDV